MRQAWLAYGLALLCSGAIGCSAYKEPGAGDPAATLCALNGATIVAIDGHPVPSGENVNTSQQHVRTGIGTRSIEVYTNSIHGSGDWTVPLALEATHDYTFAPVSTTAISLRITDQNAGGAGSTPVVKAKTAPPIDRARSMLHFDFAPGVLSIDEYPVDRPGFTFSLLPTETESVVVPGEHLIVASANYGHGGWQRWQFRFLFEAGHSYQFRNAMEKLRVKDDQTGITVDIGG